MAAGLGFKTFTTGEVLSAANVNGYLMQGILVFADAAARSAAITSPQEGQASYLKDTDVVQTYSGSAWTTVGGAAGGMTEIASGTLSGASVALSSIAGTYKDLVLDVLAFDPSDDTTQFGIRLNTDTGSNYYYAATIDNTLGSAETRIEIGGNQDNGTSTAFYRIFIPRYANTTTWKLLWGDALYNDTTSPTTVLRYKRTAATYKSTSAITAITMLLNQGTFSGGTYNLYGVN